MYTLPNFASASPTSESSNNVMPVGDFSTTIASSGGQNQYGAYPSILPGGGGGLSYTPGYGGRGGAPSSPSNPTYGPGIVPPAGGLPVPGQTYQAPTVASTQGGFGLQGGAASVPTQDPQFSNLWDQLLQSQLGQGVTPFNLSSLLPSTGQATAPGTLTAPENPLMQSLQDFFSGSSTGVSGVPGTSGPLSYVLPMWQSEIGALNQPIQEQLANIKEQFGSQGALGSTEMGTALSNFGSQTAASEQSLLGQLTLQALPQQEAQSSATQTLDQQSITNLYNEFLRTQPQYNPMLSAEQSLASTYPSVYTKQGGIGSAVIGQAGNLLGLGAGVGSSIAEGLSGGGGITDVLSSLAGLLGI